MLNREDDPTDILTRMNSDDGGGSGANEDFPTTNSVHKVKKDKYGTTTKYMFYQVLRAEIRLSGGLLYLKRCVISTSGCLLLPARESRNLLEI